MNFKKLADETFAEAWEHYHGLKIDLPTVGMEDWEFTQGFYYGLSQEVVVVCCCCKFCVG
jgi:hypothetical protein